MMKFTIERKSSLERFEAQNLAQCYIEILICTYPANTLKVAFHFC